MAAYSLHLATSADIEGILTLQSLYHISKVNPEALSNGFVTTPFTVAQIEEIIAQRGLFIAKVNTRVVAYVFAGSWQYFSQWPIFEFMITRLATIQLNGVQATVENSFQYGPICIHADFRGGQLLFDLFEFMRTNMRQRYPIALSFINQLNRRSYHAHTQKLAWKVMDEFEFNSHLFYFIGRVL